MQERATVAQQPAPNGQRIPLFNATLLMLMVTYTVHMLDRQVIAILLEPIKAEFALSDQQLGFLMGVAYSLAALVAGLPVGVLVDRYSRKKILATALAVWSGATVLCAMASSFLSLVIARAAVGAAESAAPPASLSIVADLYPPDQRSSATGLFFAAGGVGAVISFTLGGWVAQHYGWRAAFLVAGLPGLTIAAVVAFLMVEPKRDQRVQRQTSGHHFDAAAVGRDIFGTPGLPALLLTLFLAPLGGMSIGSWGASFLIRDYGVSLSQAGIIIAAASGVGMPLGWLCGGLISDAVDRRFAGKGLRVPAMGCLIGMSTGIVSLHSGSLAVTAAGFALSSFLLALYLPPGYALLMKLCPAHSRGLIISLVTILTNFLAGGMGSYLIGLASDTIGGTNSLQTAMTAALLTMVVPGLLFWRLAGGQESRHAGGPILGANTTV